MYKIMTYGKRANNKTFKTYEEARSWLRKQIRKLYDPLLRVTVLDGTPSEEHYYNPAISSYGYSITKV